MGPRIITRLMFRSGDNLAIIFKINGNNLKILYQKKFLHFEIFLFIFQVTSRFNQGPNTITRLMFRSGSKTMYQLIPCLVLFDGT